MPRIRSINFLPEVFQTETNSQFLGATLDQLVNPPLKEKIQGYIGSKFGYGLNAKDYYVTEPTKTRTDYQLDPGVIFTKKNSSIAQDFITYPGLLDALKINGGNVDNNNTLFNSEIYSWDSFVNLDKLINFNQYYWIPNGPPSVTVSTGTIFTTNDYVVTDNATNYSIRELTSTLSQNNPTISLLRGGTYTFTVDQDSDFYIQGEPGITGASLTQPNLSTRDILGVTNNGASNGVITFTVPAADAQDDLIKTGTNTVDVICTIPLTSVNGQTLSSIGGNIDGVTNLNGLTVMFYNTGSGNLFENINFYTITYSGIGDPVLNLTVAGLIPNNQKITALYGTEYVGRGFFQNGSTQIQIIPYISATLNTLYYQDSVSPNKVGIIKLVESNNDTIINVTTDILGKKNYISPNGVTFTNGLKVSFDGNVVPTNYLTNEYYVEGVGTAIQLIPVTDIVSPEPFTSSIFIPFDSTPFDIGNYDNDLFLLADADYITIARNSLNKNAWSRSNRWFHIQVIQATADYNNNSNIVSEYATYEAKAKRPIIEFYPNLKLFDSGTFAKNPVDFIDFRNNNALVEVSGQYNYYPDVAVYTNFDAIIAGITGTTTTITIPNTSINGSFAQGQYVIDTYSTPTASVLPGDAIITQVNNDGINTILTIEWDGVLTIAGTTFACINATDLTVNNYSLFDGCRIIFAADNDELVKTKIYTVNFATIDPLLPPVITLVEAVDGQVENNDHTVILRGANNQGKSYYFNGVNWDLAQQKISINQPPLFDVFDKNGVSFSDQTIYVGTSFTGSKLFAYGIGSGLDDAFLGFPLRYSGVSNTGDISFDVSFNSDTFDYVSGTEPITQEINTGYVFNYITRTDYERELGWQTCVDESLQYQLFEFNYDPINPTDTFVCDIPKVADSTTSWPTIQVYINNVFQQLGTYTVSTTSTSTTVTLNVDSLIETVVQILLVSDSVSKNAYFTIPVNLNNNPLNQNITTANVGDIRQQYLSIFVNNPNINGVMFGPNNYRDLGNVVPYGNKIIQNSASLVLPGTFLRKQNQNLFNALTFNSREYIKFKSLLVDTVNTLTDQQRFDPATVLDNALDIISKSKDQSLAFFWSDMLPNKTAYLVNNYTFTNQINISSFPLVQTYNFDTANYYGVLVYITKEIAGTSVTIQLIKDLDYTVNNDSPSLTITKVLDPGDVVTIKEYNQTYGSYVPNTPTKLGLYPSTVPKVVLDSSYLTPTYFIIGHDGSYNKLYGNYDPVLGCIDYRDQALLEFESRIYNNLKLGATIPINTYEVLPGYFRTSTEYYEKFLEIYRANFLNWVGENRLNYQQQYYNSNDEFTYNYSNSANKLDNKPILQGYWRGIYQYLFDTTTPNSTPWEMIGYTDKPSWWESRYGPSPYTIDNLILWDDMAAGYDYNNGNPRIIPEYIRPNMYSVLPVDTAGNLTSPFVSIVGNYTSTIFQRDWKVGDDASVELSYRRSSTWPFDLMKIMALSKPAKFFNLGVDLDNYRFNSEFNQYLVDDRSHLIIDNIEIYGSGTAKTSYINWIVDYEKQLGIDATQNITDLLFNLDVRLVYRLAGFSDKVLLKFFVEKGSPNSRNASLLIPDESYGLLLYDNQPFDKAMYSPIIVQIVENGYSVYGNSQNTAYFKTHTPIFNGYYDTVEVENLKVTIAKEYNNKELIVPYGTVFNSVQEVAQFIANYNSYLLDKGFVFDQIDFGRNINWTLMIQELLYWAQSGWDIGTITTLNPAATELTFNKENCIVQPLTIQSVNFILNQNLYPISTNDLTVLREENLFQTKPLNPGDVISFSQFDITNFEHGIVFDNITVFDDIIFNLITGLRQNRITVKGVKSAEWNGQVFVSGFILNQDNIEEYNKNISYTKGSIVKYKNKFWVALRKIVPSDIFNEYDWKETDYNEIQKGLLPNSSTRSYESTIYYDTNQANLEEDADLLSFSLVGYRPRDYLALVDLTDTAQIQVYKNLIKTKGTKNSLNAFKGANLPQGGIDYDVYENWAIKTYSFGGVLNDNFVEFRLNEQLLTHNPTIVSLTNGQSNNGVQQEIPLYSLFNYGTVVTNPNILPKVSTITPSTVYPTAGYVNFDDVKMTSYYYAGLPFAANKSGTTVPIDEFYVRNYVWLADYQSSWQVYSWTPVNQVLSMRSNANGTSTITFANPHNFAKYDPISIINFSTTGNGYFIVLGITSIFEVVINLTLNTETTTITGYGVALAFTSQRIATPADAINLNLLQSEFIKNTVWVDEDVDGSWSVYRKGINYTYDNTKKEDNTITYGSSVAQNDIVGYLVGDSAAGKLYRYTYNVLIDDFSLTETITHNSSYGKTISYSNNIFIVSEPTSILPKVYVYVVNNSPQSGGLETYQVINRRDGSTDWGSTTAISDDKNWLYITAKDLARIYVYRKQSTEIIASNLVRETETYEVTSVGDTDFRQLGAPENTVGMIFRYSPILGYKFVAGQTYEIASLGNTDWNSLGYVGVPVVGGTFIATGPTTSDKTGTAYNIVANTGTGLVNQITYQYINYISGNVGEGYGHSIATDYNGDTLVVGSPYYDYDVNTVDWGRAKTYQRSVQNFEVQFNSLTDIPVFIELAWDPSTTNVTCVSTLSNQIDYTGATNLENYINYPVIFRSTIIGGFGISLIQENFVYFIASANNTTKKFTIKTSRNGTTPITLSNEVLNGVTVYVQTTPLYVSRNGTLITDENYAVYTNYLIYTGNLLAGDILNISGSKFTEIQTFDTDTSIKPKIQFGTSLDITRPSTEIIIGAPFDLSSSMEEGSVYRYTNGGARYGVIIGNDPCNTTANRKILLNGYYLTLPIGDAQAISEFINQNQITNITSSYTDDNRLIISIVNSDLAIPNEKLLLEVIDTISYTGLTTLSELGISVYTYTQSILCPHPMGQTQFGTVVKFNEFDSFVVSAPVGTRYSATTFDFTDDDNFDNDTIFDNNATTFLDTFDNAGAVYMFDYMPAYNESLTNTGNYIYAQNVNDIVINYGTNPFYGNSIDFNQFKVLVGDDRFMPTSQGGKVVIYQNLTGQKDWSIYRRSCDVVNIDKIQNLQVFSAQTNNTLVNLDYFDPLQGKLLGVIAENLDYVSNIDPAKYYNPNATESVVVWGPEHVGRLWFDTSTIRFVNYHQNDNVYNSQYWGQLFPGSNVAVYSWIESNVSPEFYQGPGTVFDISQYTVKTTANSIGELVDIFYFWVRNTGIIFEKTGKTLADYVIAQYIAFPQNSGVSYFSPLLQNTFGLYNVNQYLNGNDSVLHIGYQTGTGVDVPHNEFNLIRADFADDFLPGLPTSNSDELPFSLYNKLLDSLSGVDEIGSVVPDPYLPLSVQSGIQVRPRQSFFYDRYLALKNYITYANSICKLYPILEIRTPTFLNTFGEVNPSTVGNPNWVGGPQLFYDTKNFWSAVTWWAPGYDDNTKAALQVNYYADLSALSVAANTIVAVGISGSQQFYINTINGEWVRIGLQNGTIEFSNLIFDYELGKYGFGANFFDTTVFDEYPSEETRWIIRSLNEQIFIDELQIYRNKGLVLLFEYIQSETIEDQNYLPWLNKTSLIDVEHTIRELVPIEVFQTDNQDFLQGYLNEVKPYHVVIKDFILKYTGIDVYEGDITDFDLPASYDSSINQFVTPMLVNGLPSAPNEFALDSIIWSSNLYEQWYNNRGLSLTGESNYPIAILKSYVTLSSTVILVDNISGFPTTGVIKIGQEEIVYNSINPAFNIISNFVRGYNNTTVTEHIPGQQIYIDLPAVIILNGGRGYSTPPVITAFIDTAIYPEPIIPAKLQAIMSLDTVIGVDVIDPGLGYATEPKIVIDSSVTLTFGPNAVNTFLNTITLFTTSLITGDLVKYKQGTGTKIFGLQDDQWYYINVLESMPLTIIALYDNYSDAINDHDRIDFLTQGTGTDQTLSLGAKAIGIATAYPKRENNITLKFDRTSYNSQVKVWTPGEFYAGVTYSNAQFSSSTVSLESTNPNINNILASADGTVFEVTNVENVQTIDYTTVPRVILSTNGTTDEITITTTVSGANVVNAEGTTIGFYVNMPIIFVGQTLGTNIANDTVYYVHTIVDETHFKISATESGSVYPLGTQTIGAQGLAAYPGEITNQAVMTINYPGVLYATSTSLANNTITTPLNTLGTGGTTVMTPGVNIVFGGTGYGNIDIDEIYYVNSIIDDQTFNITTHANINLVNLQSTTSTGNIVEIANTANLDNFSTNTPIMFTNMIIDTGSTNIQNGIVYYVSNVVSDTELTISTNINGLEFDPGTSTLTGFMTSQSDVYPLLTGTGNMTVNVGFPVGPGVIDGQLLSFYETSQEFINPSYTNSNLIERDIVATVANNKIALDDVNPGLGGADNFYTGMPIRFTSIDPLSNLVPGFTYYVNNYTGKDDGVGNITTPLHAIVTGIISSAGPGIPSILICYTTDELFVGMKIIFTGSGIGGVVIGDPYYVYSIPSSTTFTITDTPGGLPLETLTSASGIMTGNGNDYFTVSIINAGPEKTDIASTVNTGQLVQYPTISPEFVVRYILGGYQVLITNGGQGWAVDNTFTILGSVFNGINPTNNLTLSVNQITTFGEITSVIANGTPPGDVGNYYVKVLSANTLGLFLDRRLTIPVSGLSLSYTGTTTALVVGSSTNTLTVQTTGFNNNDPVIFTGNVASGITRGSTYYLYNVGPVSTQLTTVPNDVTTLVNGITYSNSFTMAKSGSYAFVQEPINYDRSIVRFNNRVYICTYSNNDDEFKFGKWELLDSGDRRLNAMDRTIGYYEPTVNMPGIDLSQLFTGVTYGNTTYRGNKFSPNEQFTLDTQLIDQPFYPNDIDITSVLYQGNNFIATTNTSQYSGVSISNFGNSWAITELAESNINLTDVVYGNGVYVVTTNNTATPLLISSDKVDWNANLAYVAFDEVPYVDVPLTLNDISSGNIILNSAAYGNGKYAAVGSVIVTTPANDVNDIWRNVYEFTNANTVNTLNGISYVTASGYTGFTAVGKGQTLSSNVVLNINLVVNSIDGITWNDVPYFSYNGLNGVTSNGNIAVAVGDNGIIYYTQNGTNWLGVTETSITSVNSFTNVINVNSTAGFSVGDTVRVSANFNILSSSTSYTISSILSSTQLQLTAVTLNSNNPSTLTWLYLYPVSANLNDIHYANNTFIAVGNSGLIKTSTNGIAWTTRTSGTTENLLGVTNSSSTNWTVVGENNVVLQSTDNGVTWDNTSLFVIPEPVYTIRGEPFDYGYGPEELVPGEVTDNLTMIVNTRPGTNWSVQRYQHTGYNVVSLEYTPTIGQVNFSFHEAVITPVFVTVSIISLSTELGTTIYEPAYTVNYITDEITLASPLTVGDKLRIDVYEVGNGDQLVKSNTLTDPLRTNDVTGFNEIYLNCNYSDNPSQGSGVYQTGTTAVEITATETNASTYAITVNNITKLSLNQVIYFSGSVFGGIATETAYYVKSINTSLSTITISDSFNIITGLPGPTFAVTSATGSMIIIIDTGTGQVWATPYVAVNGTRLVLGKTGTVTGTKAITNTIIVNSTGGLVVGSPVTFSDTINFSVITPKTPYNILNIVNLTEFTIEDPLNPSNPLTLTTASGAAIFIENDYSFGLQPNGYQAKLIFSSTYDTSTDYIAYSILGETEPQQYGYSLPETQTFVATGGETVVNLENYVGDSNDINAIVEINGVRLLNTAYDIDFGTESITLSTPLSAGQTLAITTYNDTYRQYLNTQYNITNKRVASVTNVQVIDPSPIPVNPSPAITMITVTPAMDWPTNTVVRFAEIVGSSELNTKAFYVLPVGGGSGPWTQFYIFTTPYTGLFDNPVFDVEAYVSGGLVWNDRDYILYDTAGYRTFAGINRISVNSTENFVIGTPVYFTSYNSYEGQTLLGGLIDSQLYYVNEVSPIIEASMLTIGERYSVQSAGISITAGEFLIGVTYQISQLGTTDWNAIGYVGVPTVGGTFVATGSGSGDGVALEDPSDFTLAGASSNVTGTIFVATATGLSGTGTAFAISISVSDTIAGDNVTLTNSETIVNAGSFVVGQSYTIKTLGTTDYTLIGASSNTIGLRFQATGIGSGTGTAQVNLFVSQFNQHNPDRLYVTINGYRVPSSKLLLNTPNRLGIVHPILPTDSVTITNMIPTATPNQETYLQLVNQSNVGTVYRANSQTRTWLTQPLTTLDDEIVVYDARNVTDTTYTTMVAAAPINDIYSFEINVNISSILLVTAYNSTTSTSIPDSAISILIDELKVYIQIESGAYISTGDSIELTIILGGLLSINGEQIRFKQVDFATNTLSVLTRGTNGVGVNTDIPTYTVVFGLLPNNEMGELEYNLTWNSYNYNTTLGDPLQISNTNAAIFLKSDIT